MMPYTQQGTKQKLLYWHTINTRYGLNYLNSAPEFNYE